jgi:hypothetical protein
MPSASSVLTAAVAVGNVVFRRSQTWSMEKMGISGKSIDQTGQCNDATLCRVCCTGNAFKKEGHPALPVAISADCREPLVVLGLMLFEVGADVNQGL